jgi:flavin-dependent dehydrogenase
LRKSEKGPSLTESLTSLATVKSSELKLEDGSEVAVIGGGPAGSFFSYFVLGQARRVGLDIGVDIYEPRRFNETGPSGCNHCGGIISESLVQLLAAEGINIPASVVQRGIDSYMLHTDVGSTRIDTPLVEKRIAAVFRGAGPSGLVETSWSSFDGYLLDLAVDRGAQVIRGLVNGIEVGADRPRLRCSDGLKKDYDLVVVATGVTSNFFELIQNLEIGYRPPRTVKTFICEFQLGREKVQKHLGTSMHVFLIDIPGLEFAAVIPKGDYATLCLLGHDIDNQMVEAFLATPEVKQLFPNPELIPEKVCFCFPRINVQSAVQPFSDRMVLVGDCGVARLYKDGIGAAYRTSKAAAKTAVLHGIARQDFEQYYWPACRAIAEDNRIGKFIFAFNHLFQGRRFSQRAVLRMTSWEQQKEAGPKFMSTILWDLFTGSAPYREILQRTFHPSFWIPFTWNLVAAIFVRSRRLKTGGSR